MNDAFLKRLRPMPRAAFVHELKARLDRLPRKPSFFGGPAGYLRTLVVALLIGGAAFAVTLMSMRHAPVVVQPSVPVAQAPAPSAAAVRQTVPAPPLAQPKEEELGPAVTSAIRRDPEPLLNEIAAAVQERAADRTGTTHAAPSVERATSTQVASGVTIVPPRLGEVEGMGASFPASIYAAWGTQYKRVEGLSVFYQAVGEGAGVKLLEKKQVTFAAVDVPMRADAVKANGYLQFPVLANAVVPVVHLIGIPSSEIVLDGPTLARIYLGEITLWNDLQIQKLNPSLGLPGRRITLVFRADGASTTYLFTEYLAKSEPRFGRRYGTSTEIDISPGTAARGNEGMMEALSRIDGAIGYVDYLYARQIGIGSVRLINQAGRAVTATSETLQSAVSHGDWSGPALGPSLTDLPGEQTWPITGASYAVLQTRVSRNTLGAALRFFSWAYSNGTQQAQELGYVPIPPTVAAHARATWAAALGGGTPSDYQRK